MVICLLNKKKDEEEFSIYHLQIMAFEKARQKRRWEKVDSVLGKVEKTPEETDSRNYIAEEYESANVPRTDDHQCVR